jgi:hypothetical protein
MRKLVLILIAFIAVITFIRAYDISAANYSGGINSSGIGSEVIQPVEE